MRAALLLAAALSAAAQTFPIAGVVVDAASGSPMKRVRVTMNPYGRNNEQSALMTGEDGKFSFDAPKGKFVLMGEYRGSRQPFGQRGPGLGFNVAIFTGPDQDNSNVVFKWYAPGAISGKVVDEHNEPVEGALVQLIRVNVTAGRKMRATAAWAYTDDRGRYRFGQRAGGAYFLTVTGEPWYSKQRGNFGPDREADAQPVPSFAPAYYPNAAEPGAAQAIDLAPGAEMNADFRLTTVTGVNVHIHCEHPQGQQLQVSLVTDGIEGVPTFQRQEWMYGNDQVIAGILPGRYQLRVDGRNGSGVARRAIEVGATDLNLDVTLTSLPAISGKVTFPGRRPRRTVYVRLVDETTNGSVFRALDSNDAFELSNVQPGRHRILLNSVEGFFVASVEVKGAPAKGVLIDLELGAQVKADILASEETGTVKGFVMNGDKPVAGVLAVLVPVKETPDPGDYRSFQTDSDGSFDYQLVRAGDYILFAADRLDLEYRNPAVVREYLASGTRVRVAPHASLVQNVSVAAQK
jgi:hypothetical protein